MTEMAQVIAMFTAAIIINSVVCRSSLYRLQEVASLLGNVSNFSKNVTRVTCAKYCSSLETCVGFSLEFHDHRTGFCQTNTNLTEEVDTEVVPNSNAAYFAIAKWGVLPRRLITSCTSSPPGYDHTACDKTYDGNIGKTFMVAKSGSGYTASTGWVRLVLVHSYRITGVRLINRCWNIYAQTRDATVTVGDVAVVDTDITFPCHNNCDLNTMETYDVIPTVSSYVRVDLTRKCFSDPGKVGLGEIQLLL